MPRPQIHSEERAKQAFGLLCPSPHDHTLWDVHLCPVSFQSYFDQLLEAEGWEEAWGSYGRLQGSAHVKAATKLTGKKVHQALSLSQVGTQEPVTAPWRG